MHNTPPRERGGVFLSFSPVPSHTYWRPVCIIHALSQNELQVGDAGGVNGRARSGLLTGHWRWAVKIGIVSAVRWMRGMRAAGFRDEDAVAVRSERASVEWPKEES